ncbi:MAG: hypothetical protein WCF16_07165 [Alphaproteobacteria bacterium]
MARKIIREMAISRAEFLRILPDAAAAAWDTIAGETNSVTTDKAGASARGPSYRVDGDSVVIGGKTRNVRIRLHERGVRKAGAFRLPTLRVSIGCAGLSEAEFDRFLARFDLYSQRGGG